MNEYIQVDTNKSMLDTYVANLIGEIEKYQRPRPDGSIDWNKVKPNILQIIKVIGDKAYNRGVEDALKCVVNGRSMVGTDAYDADYSWNDCRQQTIDNIKKLTPSKEDK